MPHEFDRIAQHLAPLSESYGGALNLTDDVAILGGENLILSTDTIVQGVHYIGNEPADFIARKLIRCNVSDLAAKGATPKYYTLNLTLSRDQDDEWFKLFCAGLAQDQTQYGLTLIGGDSTMIKEGPCVLSMTIFGEPQRSILPTRSNAKIGDIICVSGTIGDAAIGLKCLTGDIQADDISAKYLTNRYQLPEPRVTLGQKLAPIMNAAMDISDGLMQDAGHIATCSHVGLEINAEHIPLSPAVRSLLNSGKITLQDIISGGDDYEILCSISEEHIDQAKKIAKSLNEALTPIGKIIEDEGARLLDADGNAIALDKLGFTHK